MTFTSIRSNNWITIHILWYDAGGLSVESILPLQKVDTLLLNYQIHENRKQDNYTIYFNNRNFNLHFHIWHFSRYFQPILNLRQDCLWDLNRKWHARQLLTSWMSHTISFIKMYLHAYLVHLKIFMLSFVWYSIQRNLSKTY